MKSNSSVSLICIENFSKFTHFRVYHVQEKYVSFLTVCHTQKLRISLAFLLPKTDLFSQPSKNRFPSHAKMHKCRNFFNSSQNYCGRLPSDGDKNRQSKEVNIDKQVHVLLFQRLFSIS